MWLSLEGEVLSISVWVVHKQRAVLARASQRGRSRLSPESVASLDPNLSWVMAALPFQPLHGLGQC